MKKFTRFEVCGLYFILQRAGKSSVNRMQFQLCDEAFSEQPIKFSAKSYDEFFLEAEAYIGIEIDEAKRAELRSEMGSIRRPNRVRPGVFGHSAKNGFSTDSVSIAVGM